MGSVAWNPYGPIPYGYGGGAPPAYQQGPYTPYPTNPIGYNNTRDVYDMMQNQRALSQGQGDAMIGASEGAASEAQANMRGYQDLTNQLYSPIWGGGGGYTPEEQAGILQQTGPYAPGTYMTTQDELNQQYLTGDEQKAIQGNPYQPFNLVAEGQGQLRGMAADSATAQRAVPTNLATTYKGITSDPALGLSAEYSRTAPMSDAEVAAARESGAAKAGDIYGNLANQVRLNALASGTVNPLGVTAMQDQLGREGAQAATQAAVDAELAARKEQRDAAQNVENTRIGAKQYQTGTEMAAAGNVGSMQANTEQELANRAQQEQEYGMGLGSQVLGAAESAQQQRNAELANSRINSQRYADQTRYNQGYTQNQTMSGRYGNIAGVHQGVQQEGRQMAGPGGEQGFQGQQYQGDTNAALRAWQQQQAGTQAAANAYAGWGGEQNQVGFGSNFERGAGAGLGGALFGGGRAAGGNLDTGMSYDPLNPSDPYGESPGAYHAGSSSSTTVLSPDGATQIDDHSAVIPLNENRETTDTGERNPYWDIGRRMMRHLLPHFGSGKTPGVVIDNSRSDPWHPSGSSTTTTVQDSSQTPGDSSGGLFGAVLRTAMPQVFGTGLAQGGYVDQDPEPTEEQQDQDGDDQKSYAMGGNMRPGYQPGRRMRPMQAPAPGYGMNQGMPPAGYGGTPAPAPAQPFNWGAVNWGAAGDPTGRARQAAAASPGVPRGTQPNFAAAQPNFAAGQRNFAAPMRPSPGSGRMGMMGGGGYPAPSAFAGGGALYVRKPSAIIRPDGNLASAGEDGPEVIVPSAVLGSGGAAVPHGPGTGVRQPLNVMHHGLHPASLPSGSPEKRASRPASQKPGYRMGSHMAGHRSPAFA